MSFFDKEEMFRRNNNNEETLGKLQRAKGPRPTLVATGHGDGCGTENDL
jgi:hypothetical protein